MAMANTAKHRKAARPVTVLSAHGGNVRQYAFAAAASSVAVGVVASVAGAAVPTQIGDSAGSLKENNLAVLTAGAREAVTVNTALTVPQDITWQASLDEVIASAPELEQQVQDDAGQQVSASESSDNEQGVNTPAETQVAHSYVAPAPAAGGIAAIASQYLGTPYVWGGTTPAGFDCSGFVQYVYGQAGISLPRTTYGQGASGVTVSMSEAQPGDIVYWGYHVGIYMGGGMMIDAGTESTGVVYREIFDSPSFIRVS
ncbi:C40 family peptidase [Actinomyces vulturis]|uniref:C40 family peptidase n=1 Tax=Actinomyces vulturis TaxID=1857645 RepID=UPI00082AB75D|nr:C40 family peptidase [Actinomyces vulturis]